MDEYLIPFQEATAEVVEKRSRFIGHIWRVDSEEGARACIEATRKQYHDATASGRGSSSATATTGSPRAPRASPCSTCLSGRTCGTYAAW